MATCLGQPAAAGESDAAREAVRVIYADLDLTSAHDAQVMLGRLHDAALDVCGASRASLSEYRWAVGRSECVRTSMNQAVANVRSPVLSELYARETTPATE